MKKFDISSFNYTCSNNNVLYVFEVNNSKYILKKIDLNNNRNDFITINNDNIIFESFNNKEIIFLSNLEKDKLVNEIFNELEHTIVVDCINLTNLKNKIKDSYIRYLITDGFIGLSSLYINNYSLDIISIENKEIIGTVKFNNNIDIDVDKEYKESSLKLIESYINLFINKNNNEIKRKNLK